MTRKDVMPPEKMTLDVSQNGYQMKIIFQNISITTGSGTDAGVDYSALVLFRCSLKGIRIKNITKRRGHCPAVSLL